ncbi:uncharacterized protein LOC118172848 isoform X2 [Oxyura jamaicensis]|uniref:uncharacterized protein LOC118172848 isoform X2 n=1 Tax=Oxyura jamaicensis TaxID=8884 RepID=UPI0015A6F444|nr:uncharacterized protein LOC118172848 isoform X2 [Oxyura jamaicensis]
MSTLLVSSFLPLLLLAWLPAGLTHQSADSSITISASELSFKCLLQVAPYNTTVEQFIDRIKNVTEEKVEIRFLYEKSNSDFGGVNETEHETRTATCTCEKRNTSTVEAGTNQTQQESDPETSPTSTPKPQTQEGKSESKHVAEMNQLSTPQNEEVVYAKMKFEKTEIKPAASEVVYAEIKSQQK